MCSRALVDPAQSPLAVGGGFPVLREKQGSSEGIGASAVFGFCLCLVNSSSVEGRERWGAKLMLHFKPGQQTTLASLPRTRFAASQHFDHSCLLVAVSAGGAPMVSSLFLISAVWGMVDVELKKTLRESRVQEREEKEHFHCTGITQEHVFCVRARENARPDWGRPN